MFQLCTSVPARETLECKTPACPPGCTSEVSAASQSRPSQNAAWRVDSCGVATLPRTGWRPPPPPHQVQVDAFADELAPQCVRPTLAACQPLRPLTRSLSGSQRSRAAVPSCGAQLSRFPDHAWRPSLSSAHPVAYMHGVAPRIFSVGQQLAELAARMLAHLLAHLLLLSRACCC